jgi:hypothetical protein
LPAAKEIARLLAIEFAFVRTDEAEGLERARQMAAWLTCEVLLF